LVFVEDADSFSSGDHIIIEPGGLYSNGSLEEEHTVTGIDYYFPEHCCNARLSSAASSGDNNFFHYLGSPTNEGDVEFDVGQVVKIDGDETAYTVQSVLYNNSITRQIYIAPSLSKSAADNSCVCKVQPTLKTENNLIYSHATGAIVTNKQPNLITKTTMAALSGDPYWNETKLFVRSNDLNDTTDFIDYSPSVHTVNGHGEAHHTTGNSKCTSSCMLFDGSGDYLSISDHSTHKLSDTDITIDFWYKFSGHSTHGDLQLPPNDNQLNSIEQDAILTKGRWNQNAYKGWGFGLQNSGEDSIGNQQEYGHMIFYLCAGDGDGTKTKSLSTTGDVDDGNWHHVAVTHDVSSYQWSLYLNGKLQESVIQPNLSYDVDGYDLLIGAGLKYTYESPANYTPATGHFSNCLMQDARITKGIIRYTGDFVPECGYNFYSPQCVSTCYDTQYLYLEKGHGSGQFDWHLTGYREYFVDISGVDVNITGAGTSGVLTMVYPE
jgi:hypothetical protein